MEGNKRKSKQPNEKEKPSKIGSSINLWKQDPSVKPIRIRKAFIYSFVDEGPKDKDIIIEGMSEIAAKDWDGNFIFDPQTKGELFDSAHTFCVVRQVVTMYERAIQRIKYTFKQNKKIADKLEIPKPWPDSWPWKWNHKKSAKKSSPIRVYPHAGDAKNANYRPSTRSLNFFYFKSDKTNEMVYTCRSFDIVAHETGHAILDSICPNYFANRNAETGALHEAFGDLTAILTMLSQMDVCETIIAESKTDLHNKHLFLPILAEEFGEAIYGKKIGLRNADNNLKMSEVSNQVHELSNVFTGAVYDILADLFEARLKLETFDPAETLFRAGRHMTAVLFLAYTKNPKANTTFFDVAKTMMEVEYDDTMKIKMDEHFKKRGIDGTWKLKGTASYKNCCMTLQSLG